MKKIFIILLLCLILPFVVGQLTYKQNEQVDLKVPCFNSTGAICSSSALCNITVYNPSGNLLVRENPMTNSITFFNYTLNTANTTELGTYNFITTCEDLKETGFNNDEFEITKTGKVLTTSESVIYMIFLLAIMVIFLLCLWGAWVIPFRDEKDQEGNFISVSDLKMVKVALCVLCYLLLMWSFGILRSITDNFLFLEGASKLFGYLFWIMLAFTWPLIVFGVILIIILFLTGRRIKALMERGLDVI